MLRQSLLPAALLAFIPVAQAQNHAIALSDGVTLTPLIDARLRWEDVDTPARDAHAETLRVRAGVQISDAESHLSLLAEGTGTTPFGSAFSAFSYSTASDQYRPHRATIADGGTLGLNRLQLSYVTQPMTLTIGRQRLQIDDQRFVGNAPWRQNEQTFDAVRVQLRKGLLALDATHAIRQITVNGAEGGPRDLLDGSFTFISGGIVMPQASLKGFAYLLDYDKAAFLNQPGARSQFDSSQTYGFRATNSLPLGKDLSVSLASSLAWQNAYARNPNPYRAMYSSVEAGVTLHGHTATVTREVLGADRRAGWSFQTPMSSLHKFNGWADVFLTTPAAGLRDTALGLTGKLPPVKGVPRVTYTVAHHWFDADIGGTHYGKEINASLGVTIRRVGLLAKMAQYNARGFGTDTRKIWLEMDYVF
jgi:hypothetical protein